MKLSSVLLSLAACAFAEPQATSASDGINSVSALEILATALPTSLVNLALTNPAKASSVISSEFANNETPAWYSKLPKAVQTYLVPVTVISQAPAAVLTGLPSEITSFVTVSFSSMSMNMTRNMNMTMTRGKNSTTSKSGNSHGSSRTTGSSSTRLSMTPTSPSGGSGSGGSGSGPSTGAASIPTAVFGAGIAGIVGVVGLLAL